jgi:adenylate cyclase class 2
MNEIEIKVKIDDKDKFKNKLKNLGCILSIPFKQEDYVFVSKDIIGDNTGPGDIIIRIRKENGKNKLTLKQKKQNIVESKEIEFEVSDLKKAKDFILTLGYKEHVIVKKTRIKTSYKDYEICIDDVEKLGTFIEVEVMTDEEEKALHYEKEMMNFIKSLGISTIEKIDKRYDTLIYELENKK